MQARLSLSEEVFDHMLDGLNSAPRNCILQELMDVSGSKHVPILQQHDCLS